MEKMSRGSMTDSPVLEAGGTKRRSFRRITEAGT